MEPTQAVQTTPKKGGIPIWIALVVLGLLFVAVVVGIGGIWYYVRSDRLKTEREKQNAEADKTRFDLAAKQAARNTELALAKAHQEQLLSEVRGATNVLQRLLNEYLGLHVYAAGAVVEYEYLGFDEYGACYAYPLLLATA